MNTLLIVKGKIVVLIEWSYKYPQLCWLLTSKIYHILSM